MNLSDYFYSFIRHVYAIFTLFFPFSRNSMEPSALVENLDSALHLLQDSSIAPRPIAFLEFVDNMISRMMQEVEADTTYHAEWTDTAIPLDATRVVLHSFYENLERTKHTQLPEPFPSHLSDLLQNLRYVAQTLRECREARTSYLILFGWILLRRIRKCRLDTEDALRNLEKSIQPKLIYDLAFDELAQLTTLFDTSVTATPHRYRLVECAPLTERDSLRIWEFTYFPFVSYSAISYVWRGNSIADGFSAPTFSVRGAEDADPIGTEVLHDACVASLGQGAPFLWLDRLCIMQTSRNDKNWQISKMYNIYRLCSLCIVIPGGLRRLVSLQEETQWIHRGWTLQEALAPPVVQVLFSWTLGQLHAIPTTDNSAFFGEIIEVVKGRSAMAPLWLILDGCVAGSVWLYEPDALNDRTKSESVCLFGAGPKDNTGSNFQFALPHVAALALAVSRSMQEDYDRKCYTIWKCALMRTSSRPVDMIFSIMGLFNVSLDIGQFDKNDRIGATIALTQEILQQGGRANWLGLSFHAPPSPELSMFPTFPRTSVAGKALVRVEGGNYIEMSKLMDNEYPNPEVLGAMPQGSMDSDGCFTFEAKSVRIGRVSFTEAASDLLEQEENSSKTKWLSNSNKRRFKATNGITWEAYEDEAVPQAHPPSSKWQGQTFAVLLGCFFGYTPTMTLAYDCNNVRGLILEEHAPGKYHVNSYFMLSIRTIDWVVSWSQRNFCIGRSDGPTTDTDLDGEVHEIDTISKYVPPPDPNATFGNIQSKHIVALAIAAQEARQLEISKRIQDSEVNLNRYP